MKKQERKNDNRGFSLVELIVVVAIMAVLIGVLAPQYLRYVEKTRLQKDNSAISEIANTIKIAMADEDVNASIVYTGTGANNTITLAGGTGANKTVSFTTSSKLNDELKATIGDTYTTTSNTYKEAANPIVLTITNTDGVIEVKATGWIDKPKGTPTATGTEKVF